MSIIVYIILNINANKTHWSKYLYEKNICSSNICLFVTICCVCINEKGSSAKRMQIIPLHSKKIHFE